MGPGNRADNGKEGDTSCPLGFTSSDGDKAQWRDAIHSLHVAVGGPGFGGAAHPSIGLGGGPRSRPPSNARYHLFYNATIWTGEELSDHRQGGGFADALLMREGGIVVVGSLSDVRRALPSGHTAKQHQQAAVSASMAAAAALGGGEEVVEHNMRGSFLMPGLVDAHVHVVSAGLSLGRVDLRGVASRASFQQRVAEVEVGLGPGEWLLGGQWDEGEWGGEMPTAEWLDQVCGGRPAYLTRHDLHMALTNTAAMELAGLGPHSRDPKGGIIDRDGATGRPTGLLRERAMALVEATIPGPSAAERRAALAAASRHALSRGVTTLVDMGRYLAGDEAAPWQDLQEVYVPAADSGELAVRVFTMMPLRTWRRLVAWVSAHGRAHPSGRLFWGGLKEFADGSLGSRTALLWEPYSDCDVTAVDGGPAGGGPCCGQRGLADSELRELAAAAVRAGLQVAVHAIGDRAVDEVVAAFEAALDAAVAVEAGADNGPAPRDSSSSSNVSDCGDDGGPAEPASGEGGAVRGGGAVSGELDEKAERRLRLGQRLRLRVEHVQHLSGSANATAAMARASLTPVPNPLHLLTDAPMLLPRLGPARAGRAFALASLRAAGLRPALASDWPVVDLQPLTGVYAAVHRHVPPPAVAAAMRRKLPRSDSGSSSFQLVGASGPDHDTDEAAPVDLCSSGGGGGGAGVAAAEGLDGRGEELRGRGGDGAWPGPVAVAPEERLSLEEALLGHTAWGAAAAGLEDYVGRLAPGLRADFVELSDSLAEVQEVEESEEVDGDGERGVGRGKVAVLRRRRLSEARLRGCLPVVTRTWLDGELVYDGRVADDDSTQPGAMATEAGRPDN